MARSRITYWALALSMGLVLGAPIISLAKTVPNAEQLENEGRQRLIGGETITAIASLEAAFAAYQAASNVAGIRRTADMLWLAYGALGLEKGWQGDTVAALDSYQRQLEFAKLLQDAEKFAQSYLNMGSSYLWLERWTEARYWLNQGIAQARSLPPTTPSVPSGTLLERGLRLLLTLESILNNGSQIIAIASELESISASFETDFLVLQALGGAYLLQGDTTMAVEIAQDLMAFAQSSGSAFEEASALSLMGEAQLMQGDITEAIATFQEGLTAAEQADPPWLVASLQGNLGDAYAAAGDWEAALPLLEARVEQERAVGSNLGMAISLTNLGNLHLLTENWEAAEAASVAASDHWRAARMQVADPLQAISFFDTQLVTYRNWQKSLVSQGQFAEALVVAEQGRAQILTQQLTAQDKAVNQAQSISLDQLQAVARQQEVTFVEYSLMPSSQEIFIPNRINNRWLNTATELYIWVVTPDGTVAFEAVTLNEGDRDLAATILQTREAIGVRGRAGAAPTLREPQPPVDLTAQLQQLHRLLIEPISEYLPADPDAPVVFVPQESLFLVPFAALQDDTGQYLIERHTILTAPSIHALQLIQSETANRAADFTLSTLAADEVVVVGNPTMPTFAETPLASLPGAEQEAIAIATQLNTTPLLGADATETTVRDRLANARLIHLATHGLLDYGNPAAEIPGAIALATDARHDGLLTATELAEQSLVADLVVLSACDTGQGSITGDGVVGLSRSLLLAGVPRVVVSLWAVPDMPTAALMTTFYKQLDAGQDTAQALRQAMLTTMQTHPDPKDWAAFTLIGEGE